MKTIRYYLNNITLDGKQCIQPEDGQIVVWETLSPCVTLVCIYPDNSAEFQIDDSIPNCETCVRYIIRCGNCPSCPAYEKKICFCNTTDDCPDCTICVDGKCVEKCPGKLCDPLTEDCVDCVNPEQCPCNQQCIQGNCVCPDGKKKDEQGCCVDCLPGETNPEAICQKCVGGVWIQKQCPGQQVDPVTCNCVDCVDNSHCSGVNECCQNGDCVCCPGYILDPITNTCVPKPDCVTANDCPVCNNCVAGDCIPITCESGKSPVYNPITGRCDCLTICNCADPQSCLSQRDICVDRNNDGICNCHTCDSRYCDENNPCEKGCLCINNQCTKNPCGQDCSNGQNCPDGCGCFNGTCVPCTYLSCLNLDCSNAYGCRCNGAGNCVESPCTNACPNGAADCGYGCGCKDARCVDCSSVSCQGGAPCPEGCYCDNGVCKANPCSNKVCINSNDCGQGCGCKDGLCVPCSSLDCNVCNSIEGCVCTTGICEDISNKPCSQLTCDKCPERPDCICTNGLCQDNPDNGGCRDKFYFEKGDCDLKLVLETMDCCQCESLHVDITSVQDLVDPDLYVFSGVLKINNTKLSDIPIEDSVPQSGVLQFKIIESYRMVDEPYTQEVETRYVSTTQYVDSDTESTVGITMKALNTIKLINNINYTLISRDVYFKSTEDFDFQKGSNCRYNVSQWRMLTTGNNLEFVDRDYQLDKLTICRRPIFSIIKSDTRGGSGTYIPDHIPAVDERVYANLVGNGKYEYVLQDYDNYDLEHGKFYRAKVDCGCKRDTDMACPLIFCHPTITLNDIEVTGCGKTLKFKNNIFVNCDVYNQEAASGVGPQYRLLINGSEVDIRRLGIAPATSNILYAINEEFTITTQIDSVEFKIVGDTCNECPLILYPPSEDIGIETFKITGDPCGANDAVMTATITGVPVGDSYTWSLEKINIPPPNDAISNGTTSNPNLVQTLINATGNYRLTVTYDTCTKTKDIYYQKGTGLINEVSITGLCSPDARIAIVNGTIQQVKITASKGSQIKNLVLSGGVSDYISVEAGTWSVVAELVSDPTCNYTTPVIIDCCQGELTGSSVVYECGSGVVYIHVPAEAVVYTSKIPSGAEILTQANSALDAGNYTYRIVEGFCQKLGDFTVPQCKEVDENTQLCVNAVPNKGFADCTPVSSCDDWDGVSLTATYDCSRGLILTTNYSGSGTIVYYLNRFVITNGTSLAPGTYAIEAVVNGCSKLVSVGVQQCYECNGNSCRSSEPNLGAYSNQAVCGLNCSCTPGYVYMTYTVDCTTNTITFNCHGVDEMDFSTLWYGGISHIVDIKGDGTHPTSFYDKSKSITLPLLNGVSEATLQWSTNCSFLLKIESPCGGSETGCQNPISYNAVWYGYSSNDFMINNFIISKYPNWTPITISVNNSSIDVLRNLINTNTGTSSAATILNTTQTKGISLTSPNFCLNNVAMDLPLYSTTSSGGIVSLSEKKTVYINPVIGGNKANNTSSLYFNWNIDHRYPIALSLTLAKNNARAQVAVGDLDYKLSISRSTLKNRIQAALNSFGVGATYYYSYVEYIYTSSDSSNHYFTVNTYRLTNGVEELITSNQSYPKATYEGMTSYKMELRIDGDVNIAGWGPAYKNAYPLKVVSGSSTSNALETHYYADYSSQNSCNCEKILPV